jgi:hypothetical protein
MYGHLGLSFSLKSILAKTDFGAVFNALFTAYDPIWIEANAAVILESLVDHRLDRLIPRLVMTTTICATL